MPPSDSGIVIETRNFPIEYISKEYIPSKIRFKRPEHAAGTPTDRPENPVLGAISQIILQPTIQREISSSLDTSREITVIRRIASLPSLQPSILGRGVGDILTNNLQATNNNVTPFLYTSVGSKEIQPKTTNTIHL